MSRERLVRLERVLEARQRIVDRCELELAELTRGWESAVQAATKALADLTTAQSFTIASLCSSLDLDQAHAYAVTLGRRYDVCVRATHEARGRRDAGLARLTAARVEVRKVELWKTRILEAAAAEDSARERRAMDELAARTVRTG